MKSIFALIALVGFSFPALAKTEAAPAVRLQFFENYDPKTGKYDGVFYSTPKHALSAEYLMDYYGLCYKGSVAQLQDLFGQMMDKFEARHPHSRITGRLGKKVIGGKTFITIKFNDDGYEFGYPQVRECLR